MPTTYPIRHSSSTEPLPTAPDGLVYFGRDITNPAFEDGASVTNTYVTTGCFRPDAPDQTVDHLLWAPTLVMDFDLADYLFGELVPADKADAAIAELKKVHPKLRPPALKKIIMYRSARKGGPEKLAELRAKHLARVMELLAAVTPNLQPSRVVDSGWGYHVYHWLQTPAEGDDIKLLRSTNAELVRAVNQLAGYSCADDGVHDAGTRILRLAGTENTKDHVGGARPVTVLSTSEDRWVLGETEVVAPAVPAPATPGKAAPARVKGTPVETLFSVPVSLPEDVQALIAGSTHLRNLYEGKGKPLTNANGEAQDVSGSGYDMSLACALAKKGVAAPDIAATIYMRNGGAKDLRHCNRTAQAAIDATGTTPSARRAADRLTASGADASVLEMLGRTKDALPKATMTNLITVLENDARLKGCLFYERRTMEVRLDPDRAKDVRALLSVPARPTLAVVDEDLTALRAWCSRTYEFEPSKDAAFDAVVHVAQHDVRDPLLDQLLDMHKTWDAVPRIDTWLRDFAGVVDTPLSRAYARRTLIAAVARAFAGRDHPAHGCKVDTVLVLKGLQGKKKSTLLRALAGADHFSDSHFDVNNKDSYLAIRRPWIYEVAEMTGLSRKEADDVKRFLTSQSDNFRPPYGRVCSDHPRQGIFVGTTNRDTFLNDPTGSRRFWPVTVGRCDPEGLRAVREQLWGEAVQAYLCGEKWWLEEDMEEARAEDAEQYTVEDPYVAKVVEWLGTIRDRPFTLSEVVEGAVKARVDDFDRWKGRVSKILTDIGCTSTRPVVDGRKTTMWRAPSKLTATLKDDGVEELFKPAPPPAPPQPTVMEVFDDAARRAAASKVMGMVDMLLDDGDVIEEYRVEVREAVSRWAQGDAQALSGFQLGATPDWFHGHNLGPVPRPNAEGVVLVHDVAEMWAA